MAASGAPVRQLRRGPAPIASFDHDVSDEVRPPSSPETKQTFRLPEIREDPASSAHAAPAALAPPEQRARSHSTPAAGLHTPAAPRIDISRASSSSHHDSRDSSPELALFAGTGDDTRTRLELGFREDGALELRSSTEELAFLEGAPGEPRAAAPPPPAQRRHSRKDSQGSEAALLAVSGRTSRLSSVGSQCSAHSALSTFSHRSRHSVGRLSVVSGVSRSPSPHRMLLETSFCGPKPIETDPEICAAAVEERLLEIAKLTAVSPGSAAPSGSAAPPESATPPALDARDRREVRTEATVERVARAPPPSPLPAPAPAPLLKSSQDPAPSSVPPMPAAVLAQTPVPITAPMLTSTPAISPAPDVTSAPALSSAPDDDKLQKETQNRARAQERRARPRVRREPSEPEVYKSANRSKDIIRIKLKPDDDYEEEEDESMRTRAADAGAEVARKPASLELAARGERVERGERAVRPTELLGRPAELPGRPEPAPTSPRTEPRAARDSRSPSPAGVAVSRKSSFCSLFKSRETIASPDSPSDALRRKRSLTEGRSRSKSRDRSATPTSAGKIRGSVLSLFRTPRKSIASPSPSSREGSPVVQPQRQIAVVPSLPVERVRRGDKLKYYEDTKDGIIHIPLRTPPDERPGLTGARRESETHKTTAEVTTHREPPRPASAPQSRPVSEREFAPPVNQKPMHRTVLPDGSIIIPLRSPTERPSDARLPSPPVTVSSPLKPTPATAEENKSETPVDVPATTTPTPPQEVSATIPSAPPADAHRVESATIADNDGSRRRKERLVFTTHVGSREQVFSTQFSITKTPSVTSEISGSFPSFVDGDEIKTTSIRDVAPAADCSPAEHSTRRSTGTTAAPSPASPPEPVRDSSESEPSSESAPPPAGDEVEKRGLVVQQSFEEELPYVPTTLPQERSVALPMVPVRERGGVRVSGVSRPRPPPPAPAPPAPRVPRPAPLSAPPLAATQDKLRIRLPRRPSTAAPAPRRPDRPRTRSGSDSFDSRPKTEWIDFEEVPERRKQPKRIQTLPAAAAASAGAGEAAGGAGAVVFSYVEPEHCRCECHAHTRDDELPLLQDDMAPLRVSSSSLEGEEEARAAPQPAPFTADLDLQPGDHHQEARPH